MNVLIISHGHPALSAGGGERAAYSLFEHLKRHRLIGSAVFASRATREQVGHSAQMGLFRGRRDEPLVAPPEAEWPSLMSLDYNELLRCVQALIAWTKPDVVHVHHFAFWSLDLLEILYRLDMRVVFTFHEYMAICQNLGQMIKTDRRLCEAASPAECNACFPDFTPGQFFLREQIFRTYLSYCDRFLAPSKFLLDRYVNWGLDPDASEVVENPLAPAMLERGQAARVHAHQHPPERAKAARRVRFGFFGQINKFKGVDVLLRAVALLPSHVKARLEVGIHGANLDHQEDGFKTEISELLAANKDVLAFFGPYDNQRVPDLMTSYDWVVVPSIWWENSPVVIQEALLMGKPVLCARIGGMAEKVRENVTGRYFEPGSASDLARQFARIVEEGDTPRIDVQAQIALHTKAVERHVDIYRRVAAA
jgi:glycosyltransferase involved in cell wall biosynthesis